MNEHKEEIRKAAEVAQFRFGIIAPVIQDLYPDASRTAFYKRVTASTFTLPDGSVVKYNYKTIPASLNHGNGLITASSTALPAKYAKVHSCGWRASDKDVKRPTVVI
ncbi:MAG: hypothetical protein Q4E24_15810 [bacterium]|nr:hypothetical protein [bacterium]